MNTIVAAVRPFFPSRRHLGRWAITFLAYLITAKLGQLFYGGLETSPALIWPPTGLALAAIFIFGFEMTSAVTLAAFVASASNGAPILVVLASTMGNALQAVAGAYLFRKFDFHPNIQRLRDTLLLLGAALIITTIAPTAISIGRILSASPGDTSIVWKTLWAGGVLSVLVITPLITGFLPNFRLLRDRMLEHTLALFSVGFMTYLVFWKQAAAILGIPLVYVFLVPLFWIALRFSPRSTAIALFLSSVIALSGAYLHVPPNIALGQWLYQTEMFLEIIAVIFLIVSSAIEDRRTSNARLEAHVAQLEEALTKINEQDASKNDFLAILAHELRNPLAPVLSTLELLRMRRNETEEEAHIIAGAEQRLHMMGRLLDDLLDISRVSEKRLKLQREHVRLCDIVERSVEGARPMMEKFRHTFTYEIPDNSIVLYADPMRIEQVLVNVLNNAAKYTPENGVIELSAQAFGSRATVTIRDNGTGIESTMLSKIFEPFLQITNTKYGTSGVGVGLTLAKQLVEMHGGTISALSAGLGRGSTFVIEFPTMPAVAVETIPPSSPPVSSEPVSKMLTILIIDDNQAGTDALGRLLKFRGHRTVLAYSGVEGIQRAREEKPDAILLDIGLPDIDGYEVARRLRLEGSPAFIVALTGYGQDDDRRKALDAGCDAHLTKPIGLHDIEVALRSKFGA